MKQHLNVTFIYLGLQHETLIFYLFSNENKRVSYCKQTNTMQLIALKSCLNRLNNILDTIDGCTKFHNSLLRQLSSLHTELKKIYDNLIQVEVDDSNSPGWLQITNVINQLLDMLPRVEGTLSHLLDILELETDTSMEIDFDTLVDYMEISNELTNGKLKPLVRKMKLEMDVYLEYNEILNDNMNSLNITINNNIDGLFKIQDSKYESPVRHIPNFTLDQLLRLLTTNTTNKQYRLPKFTPLEERMMNKFEDVQKNLKPIETSLMTILPNRINEFYKRHTNFENIKILHETLLNNYNTLSRNFQYLNKEVSSLKIELVDKRWNIIFTNLNHELSFILNEMEKNSNKLIQETDELNDQIKVQLLKRLNKSTDIVSRTFNVIYTALEFSLLDKNCATETNQLAEKWLQLRSKTDELLLNNDMIDNTEIEQNIEYDKTNTTIALDDNDTNHDRSFDMSNMSLEPPPPILMQKVRRRISNSSLNSGSESDSGNKTIEAIADDLRKFSLGSSVKLSPERRRNTNRNFSIDSSKTGAVLFKKVNVSPEQINDPVINENEIDNPFFDNKKQVTRKERKVKTRSLILSTIPTLSYLPSNTSTLQPSPPSSSSQAGTKGKQFHEERDQNQDKLKDGKEHGNQLEKYPQPAQVEEETGQQTGTQYNEPISMPRPQTIVLQSLNESSEYLPRSSTSASFANSTIYSVNKSGTPLVDNNSDDERSSYDITNPDIMPKMETPDRILSSHTSTPIILDLSTSMSLHSQPQTRFPFDPRSYDTAVDAKILQNKTLRSKIPRLPRSGSSVAQLGLTKVAPKLPIRRIRQPTPIEHLFSRERSN